MDNSLQTALKNLIDNQATSDELELLRHAFSDGQIFIGGNVRNSVIIARNGNTVTLSVETLELLTTANESRIVSALHQLPQPPADFGESTSRAFSLFGFSLLSARWLPLIFAVPTNPSVIESYLISWASPHRRLSRGQSEVKSICMAAFRRELNRGG